MHSHRSRQLTIEQASDYTGYNPRIIREAFKRGDLTAERPGGFERARLYFDPAELDRWLDSIKAGVR
ncbi:helix-turn-helix domain-containing protein [Pseudonocardia sp. D17]|uniref:helix-turn-helix domain-containing protein n=1 Tax=Pseudonocardia sp. D17 TaxID=882661 RepID=UPI002B3845E4|nr:hypothetical protein PSD17_06530 [Pseudonocardia sp. D17]